MTPNDIDRELRDELSKHVPDGSVLGQQLTLHKTRRDASIDAATVGMSMRVQRARNGASKSGSNLLVVRLGYTVSAVAATVLLFVSFNTVGHQPSQQPRSMSSAASSMSRIENDVEVLTDDLLRRNASGTEQWTVTDADVDRLLGDADIEL